MIPLQSGKNTFHFSYMLLMIILEFGAQSPKRIISTYAHPAMIFMFIYGFSGLLRFLLFFILLLIGIVLYCDYPATKSFVVRKNAWYLILKRLSKTMSLNRLGYSKQFLLKIWLQLIFQAQKIPFQ